MTRADLLAAVRVAAATAGTVSAAWALLAG